jgi:hypothetical protein
MYPFLAREKTSGTKAEKTKASIKKVLRPNLCPGAL